MSKHCSILLLLLFTLTHCQISEMMVQLIKKNKIIAGGSYGGGSGGGGATAAAGDVCGGNGTGSGFEQ